MSKGTPPERTITRNFLKPVPGVAAFFQALALAGGIRLQRNSLPVLAV